MPRKPSFEIPTTRHSTVKFLYITLFTLRSHGIRLECYKMFNCSITIGSFLLVLVLFFFLIPAGFSKWEWSAITQIYNLFSSWSLTSGNSESMHFVQNWAWLVTWSKYAIYSTLILDGFCSQLTLHRYLWYKAVISFILDHLLPPPSNIQRSRPYVKVCCIISLV